jgi:hypothetical protein
MALLDTHAVIGVKKKQAEIITKAISQGNDDLVTNKDLRLTESNLNPSISNIETELKWLKALVLLILGLVASLWFK